MLQHTVTTAKYIDTEAIASQIIDASLAYVQQQAIAENDIFGILGSSLGLAEIIRPQMQAQMEQILDRGLQQIPDNNGMEDIKLISIDRNEQTATATFKISNSADEDFPLKSLTLTLEQQPNRQWQITGLSKESLKFLAEAMERQ